MPPLKCWGGGSSSRKAQDLTEMWVSFGLLPPGPDPPGPDVELFP